MNARHIIVRIVLWLTRITGALLVLLGFVSLVPTWRENHSWGLVGLDCAVAVLGAVLISLRVTPDKRLQYGLLRWTVRK